MKIRKLYDKPKENGFYYCISNLGCMSFMRFHDDKWYKQTGDGSEIEIREQNLIRASWLDQESESPIPLYIVSEKDK